MLFGMKEKEIELTNGLKKLALKFKNKAEIFIVGGYVRNSLLGIDKGDVDLCSALTPDELISFLKYSDFVVKEKNKRLGTVTISIDGEVFEHTTFRKETYDGTGKHRPEEVEFVKDIREDAKRRDFSVNCIYYSLAKNRFIDIYSGIYDLSKHKIKTIETPEYVFQNDGLRILRMIRLACELNFKIDKSTYLTACTMAYRVKDVSGARKYGELKRIVNANKKYAESKKNANLRGIKLLNYLKLWTALYTPLGKLKPVLSKKSKDDKFIALLIDIVNGVNPDCVEYFLNDMLGTKGFNLTEKQKNDAIYIVGGYFDALNRRSNKQYFYKYFEYFSEIRKYLQLTSKQLYSKYNFFYRYLLNNHVPILVKDLKINGDDIKIARPKMPQKEYSNLLRELLDMVFEGKIENEKSALIKQVKVYEYDRNN